MLGFLKRLFGSGAQPAQNEETRIVKLSDIESWLHSARQPIKEQIQAQLTLSKTRIAELSALAKEKVNALQSAQLMNPDIPDRAKDFMTGNREEYSRRVLSYIDKLSLPENTEHLSSFFDQHADDAKEFTQGILRPFQILQEFFSHESKEITALLADAEREIEAVRVIHSREKQESYVQLHAQIEVLLARQRQLAGLHTELKDLEKQKAESEKAISSINAEETRLLNDAERQQLLKKSAEAEQKTRAHEQKIRDVFNNFEPALRKFHRMATRNVKLLDNYLRDPVRTLIEDLHLDILEAVGDIDRLLKFDRIPLGDRKEYVRDAIALLNKEYLGSWMSEYGKLTKAEKDTQAAIEDCTASKTLKRIIKLRDDTRRNLQITTQRLENVTKDIEKINLELLKQKLEADIKNVVGKSIQITF